MNNAKFKKNERSIVMKKVLFLVLLCIMSINAQSIVTIEIGASILIDSGADICADSINSVGSLIVNGTVCGNPTSIDSKDDNTVPKEYALNQNYPNPFNPSTKIRYSIPNVIASETKQSVNVTLKVYDVLGNEVATLVNEEKETGVYTINLDASQLASGVYFYRLLAGSFVETKKMILLR